AGLGARGSEPIRAFALRWIKHLTVFLGRDGFREQEALQLMAARRAHETMLLLRLDAFGGDRKPERTYEPRHAFDDRGGFLGDAQVLHEGFVDLDLVDREASQIAERRIAGAEIVQHDANAH